MAPIYVIAKVIFLKTTLYLLLILPLMIYLLFKLLMLKLTITTYKITNWFFTLFFCSFYICFFFLFLFIFRIIRNPIDLYAIYIKLGSSITTIKELPLFNQILILYTIIIIIIIWLLLFIKIYNICCNEWIKIHFYLYFKYMEKYQDILNIFINKYIITRIRSKIYCDFLFPIILKIYEKYPYQFIDKFSKKIALYLKIYFPYLHYIILCFVIFYDLVYNNYVLFITTNYLPIFMLYALWKRISDFLEDQNPSFNKVIAEQYYNKNVVYVNFTEDHFIILENYLKTFKTVVFDPNNYIFNAPIITLHRYVLITADLPENNYYYNDNLFSGFNVSDLIKIDDKYFVDNTKLYPIINFSDEE